MTSQAPSSHPPANSRLFALGEWLLVLGLVVTVAWTTLCLGGYMAKTMVVTSQAVFALAALGGLLWTLDRTKSPRTIHLAVFLPVPFLLYALASVVWLAPAQWLAWREWLLCFQMWLVFTLVLHWGRGRLHSWMMVLTFMLLGLAGVGMAIYQRFQDPTWMMLGLTQADQFAGRSSGMFGIPNSLAGLLELMIPACLSLLFSRAIRFWGKVVCGLLAAAFLFAVVLTGSRGGWLGVGLALLMMPLFSGREWRRKLLGFGAILLVISSVFFGLYRYSDYAQERIRPFLEGKFESSRPIIWKAGWQIWRDHPWFGSGAASYNVLFDQYRPRGFLNEPDWAHNDYLNTLSDYGVIGYTLWVGAGGWLLWLGWKAAQRARREQQTRSEVFQLWRWRFGLWVGLIAFAIHLLVDFHTKLPALALAAVFAIALLIRDEKTLIRPLGPRWRQGAGIVLIVASLLIGWRVANPLYQAEALRFDARRAIDRYANTGNGEISSIATESKAALRRAVRIDPSNGQAWADLSYATVQGWRTDPRNMISIGRSAELAGDEALRLCALNAEFWVRKGVSLDLQRGRPEAESCFKQALALAPNAPRWWYHYAYHLEATSLRKSEVLAALDTCLALDPSYPGAEALRQQLLTRR